MKLISLNTWGGKYFEPLIDFIKQHQKDTDIFCLQEIYDTTSDVKQYKNIIRANLKKELENILTTFQVFYFPILFSFDDQANAVDFYLSQGIITFVKKSYHIDKQENHIIYKDPSFIILEKDFSNQPVPLQYLKLVHNNKHYSIFNYHGTPHPPNKLDAPNRLGQAKIVRGIMDSKEAAKIIIGDFNILPETKTLEIIGADMRNLIKEYHIPRTRSNLSPYAKSSNFQKFADYTFVSKEVKIINFEVPDIDISDHLPMILEFE